MVNNDLPCYNHDLSKVTVTKMLCLHLPNVGLTEIAYIYKIMLTIYVSINAVIYQNFNLNLIEPIFSNIYIQYHFFLAESSITYQGVLWNKLLSYQCPDYTFYILKILHLAMGCSPSLFTSDKCLFAPCKNTYEI